MHTKDCVLIENVELGKLLATAKNVKVTVNK